MINRNNKKGFTIVELVIVIAVIAILAAVLIPTFSGIIRKANISADTQLAKNLNEALAADEAIDGKPANFSEVLVVFRENGYIVANLNPTAAGCYFVWESETNQIILLDAKKGYEVIYASKELTNKTPGATWYFAVSNEEDIATLEGESFGSSIKILYAPKTADELTAAINKVHTAGGKQSLVISADVALNNDQFMVNKTDAEISLDLGGNVATLPQGISYTVPKDYLKEGKAYTRDFNAFTSANGVLNISNGEVVSTGNSKYAISAIQSGTVNVNNIEIKNMKTDGSALRVFGKDAVMNVKDTTLDFSSALGIEVGSGEAVFDNVNVTVSATEAYWLYTCVAASRGGKLTINSGNYAAKGSAVAPVSFFTSSGTIIINGGTFTSDSGKIFYLSKNATDDYNETHTLTIKGGTFAGKSFSEFKTAADWALLFGGDGYTFNESHMTKNADGSWTFVAPNN